MENLKNLEAERGLLGCCLLGGIRECISAGVDGTWFYDLRHHEVYRTIEELHERNEEIDISKVIYELRSKKVLDKVGGTTALTEWEDQAPTAHNASYWLTELFSYRIRRQTKAKLENALHRVSGASVEQIDETLSDLQSFILDISDHVSREKDETIKESIIEVVSTIEERFHNKTETPWGIPTGWNNLDNALGGLRNGALYVLAGRPGVGKTAMGLGITLNVTQTGTPVAIFSLEMQKEELAKRLMAAYAEIDMTEVHKGQITKMDFVKLGKAAKLNVLPLYVNERTDITINMMRSDARRYVKNYGVRLIVVDYLQLIAGTREAKKHGKYEVVSEISRGLKIMAQELDVPVLALAQLNREYEKAGGSTTRKPRLSDLRDSGSIEQDADCCLFIYEGKIEETSRAEEPQINCLVAKNRNGQPGLEAYFDFLSEYTKFVPKSPVF